jgi:hypothetical protein
MLVGAIPDPTVPDVGMILSQDGVVLVDATAVKGTCAPPVVVSVTD